MIYRFSILPTYIQAQVSQFHPPLFKITKKISSHNPIWSAYSKWLVRKGMKTFQARFSTSFDGVAQISCRRGQNAPRFAGATWNSWIARGTNVLDIWWRTLAAFFAAKSSKIYTSIVMIIIIAVIIIIILNNNNKNISIGIISVITTINNNTSISILIIIIIIILIILILIFIFTFIFIFIMFIMMARIITIRELDFFHQDGRKMK